MSGAYRLTRAGEQIVVAFDRLLDTVDKVNEFGEFLNRFPSEVETPAFLDASDATVTYATDAAPYAPARKQSEILHTTEELRILLSAVDIDSTEILAEQVRNRGIDVETIVSPAVESVLTSDEFAPRVRQMVQTDGLSIRVSDEEIPFHLGLADGTTVQVGLAGEDGLPRALLENGDEAVYAWAERFYRDVRDSSEIRVLEDL